MNANPEIRPGYHGQVTDAVLARAAGVRLLVLDVDGVLTDGSVYMGHDGELCKGFHIHDGKGIRLLQQSGVEVALLTARRSPILERRAAELGIQQLIQGSGRKGIDLERLQSGLGIPAEACAYMGDDLQDLPALRRCGLAVTVADGHPLLTRHCHWQTRRPGGRGAVRELCELILAARGELDALLQAHEDAD
ncbi:KdsC family phosphatase [Alkalilimnicola ehrlichii MLHE-1]|uniref:3-deoxy-D-manno-octulosonate 8-phosphate phosphatase KdsC n=1 Tax=Alkalilimnicola ehrlichii (strain ATCC BAA-1101 / DSM 17681 / MLHE-1) TaxID=187272 RepID=Q0A6G9_ALKEH|nr:HAD-IIIA family hydrolase [Alkalilimnicola ehrlichii]ABI57568.1 3-deoxy-D-manno-octulosonate 8-phosphate phosphatase, YrbI family [Alkalilimnicola ehrlichii MLHE-1]